MANRLKQREIFNGYSYPNKFYSDELLQELSNFSRVYTLIKRVYTLINSIT